jgi:Protein of unknown function (DUF1207)
MYKLKYTSLKLFSLMCSLIVFCIHEHAESSLTPCQNILLQQNSRCGENCNCGCQSGSPCTCEDNYQSNLENALPMAAQISSFRFAEQSLDNYLEQQEECTSIQASNEDECEEDQNLYELFDPEPGLRDYEIMGHLDGGFWLPEDPVLFRPFMADPREIDYSVGWRFNDNALTKNIIGVSFGDSFALYRWCDIGPWHGELQIELEGGVWAVFDPVSHSSPLINADYYVGFPLTYAFPKWQFRLRGFHISSHIGDEFLIDHPGFDRRNASAEYLDFFVSHDLTKEIRLYGGIGYVVLQDKEFKTKRLYGAAGAELRLLRLGFYDEKDVLYGCPIYGMHFRGSGDFRNHIDSTFILGYEFGKMCGLYRKVRFFFEYHDGYSVEGQFGKIPTNYLSFRMSYGY